MSALGRRLSRQLRCIAAVKAGHQGALMVPTEILAEQHLRSLQKLFARHGARGGTVDWKLDGAKKA